MNWEMIGAVCVIVSIFGGLMVAAAKSIFVTQKDHDKDTEAFNLRLYNKGVTIFVPRMEWDASRAERERRQDIKQRMICDKIDEMQKSIEALTLRQNETNVAISNLLGRLEPYLKPNGD